MACVCGINLSVCGQNRISSSPAETNGSDLDAWSANTLDEGINQRLGNALLVLEKPWSECGSDIECSLCFLEKTGVLLDFEGWLDGVQEFNGKRVALVNIGNVAVETVLGVVVGEKANVLELPSEDYRGKLLIIGLGRIW